MVGKARVSATDEVFRKDRRDSLIIVQSETVLGWQIKFLRPTSLK